MRTVDIAGIPVGDGHPPRVMGVLNMSGESNYDPSVYPDPERAAEFVAAMAAEGADIVDIGLQSSNPKNDWLPESVEQQRLDRAIAVMEAVTADVALSIETRYASVADDALAAGFDMVNDVCGFADPQMPAVCEAHDAPVVKMASPPDLTKPGHLTEIDEIFDALERGGFTEKTIIDPGFGGWNADITHEDNWELFRRLREFRAFGRPMLTATNREDFLGVIADRPKTEDQLPVSLAAATMEVERGADIIRTHDVPETKDVIQLANFLGDDGFLEPDSTVFEVEAVSAREIDRTRRIRGERSDRDGASVATKAFQLHPSEERVTEAVLAWATEANLLVAGGIEDGVFLAGTVDDFRRALESIPSGPAQLAEIAGTIRRSLPTDHLVQ